MKNVIVSGGSSGIGFAFAKRLAEEGFYNIVIAARNKQNLDAKAEELKKINSNIKIYAIEADVTDEASCLQLFASGKELLGYIHLAVNCAGIARPDYFENISFDKFSRVVSVNLFGVRNFSFAAVSAMKESGGHIVNCSSLAGLVSVFGYTDYCASKAGIIGFSEALRQEMAGKNIKVQVLCPPDTDTEGFVEENRTKPYQTVAISEGAKLMSAESVADYLFRKLKSGKFLIIPGLEGRMTWRAKRFAPGLVERVMNRIISKEEIKHEKNN